MFFRKKSKITNEQRKLLEKSSDKLALSLDGIDNEHFKENEDLRLLTAIDPALLVNKDLKKYTSILPLINTYDDAIYTQKALLHSAAIAEASGRNTRKSIWIASAAIVIAVVFGVIGYFGSRSWQHAQIKELKTQTQLLSKQLELQNKETRSAPESKK